MHRINILSNPLDDAIIKLQKNWIQGESSPAGNRLFLSFFLPSFANGTRSKRRGLVTS